MAKKLVDEKCFHDPNSIEDEEDQEEALSLCDLPTNEDESRTEAAAARAIQSQDDFDFGSWSSSSLLTQPEMCAADDIFFQGQILPLRHSISSESGIAKFRQDSNYGCISRSASMDHHCWGGGFMSSRSSSIRSHNSASSGSTSTTTTLPPKGKGYRPKLRNQFHSHPSPTPQIRIPSNRQSHNNHLNPKSTMWRFFQVGLLRTPEMELKNLKVRTRDNIVHSFGSRNSNSSISTSSSSISSSRNAENKKIENSKKMKLHSGLFGISCKCSVDAIETVPLNIVIVKNSSNNKKGSEKEDLLGKGGKKIKKKLKKKMKGKEEDNQGKQTMSRHRTFEWLKQLSLQEGATGAGAASSSRPDQV